MRMQLMQPGLRGAMVACALAACGGDAPATVDAALDAAVPVDATVDAAPDADVTPDGSTICLTEDRDDPYVPGMEKVGANGYRVALGASVPGPPEKGDNHWTVQVHDATGAAVNDLGIDVIPFMPDHGHGTPVAEIVTATGAEGLYEIDRVNLWMRGLWTNRVVLRDAQGAELDRVTFAFCIDRP